MAAPLQWRQLSIAANGSNGIAQDDATTPSSRSGTPFSQFFGLNDLFQSGVPSIAATGLSSGDASGIAAGGNISLSLKVDLMATFAGGHCHHRLRHDHRQYRLIPEHRCYARRRPFTLNSDGSITTQTSALYPNYQLNVTNDTTQRGSTGVSFTELFGIGDNQIANQAIGFQVVPAVANAISNASASSSPSINSSTTVGGTVVLVDSSGRHRACRMSSPCRVPLLLPGGLTTADIAASFDAVRRRFIKACPTNRMRSQRHQTTQDDRLTEAQTRLAANWRQSGRGIVQFVVPAQQAYSAGARILTVVDQLYQTLLGIQ